MNHGKNAAVSALTLGLALGACAALSGCDATTSSDETTVKRTTETPAGTTTTTTKEETTTKTDPK